MPSATALGPSIYKQARGRIWKDWSFKGLPRSSPRLRLKNGVGQRVPGNRGKARWVDFPLKKCQKPGASAHSDKISLL